MFDPLQRTIELAHRTVLFPLGFPLALRSNDARILSAARESWGRFEQRFEASPLDLRIVVSADGTGELPPQPSFRAQGSLTAIVSDRFNFATFDSSRGLGFAWVQESVAADSAFFRWWFLEAMVYYLLTEQHLTPIHAGCVAKAGRGVLLLGDSGAGKSTLAFGCARLGWTFVSDDAVWMLRGRSGRRVLGLPQHVRLRASCAELFPELNNRPVGLAVNGKPMIQIGLNDFPTLSLAAECEVAACVFLRRDGSEQPSLEHLPAQQAYERIVRGLVCYDQAPREEQLLSLKRLVEAPAYELRYRDVERASETLHQLI